MIGRIVGALFCLAFAVSFGGVGVLGLWLIGASVMEGVSARDWVRVRADVVKYDHEGVRYRYAWDGKEHFGTRYGIGHMQPSEADGETDGRLSTALAEKRPITVFVNPADPSRSALDATIPWGMLAMLLPFALVFGGVGAGALWMMVGGHRGDKKPAAQDKPIAPQGGGLLPLWIFALCWSAFTFPIAIAAVPPMVASGEWVGLFVLVFPLVGLILLAVAIRLTWKALRRGGAKLQLQTPNPRLGSVLSGYVTLPRGVTVGEEFRVRLACVVRASGAVMPEWSAEKQLRVAESPQGPRLTLHFDLPRRAPKSAHSEKLTWELELFHPDRPRAADYRFGIEVMPASGAALEAEPEVAPDEDEEMLAPAGLPAGFEGLRNVVGEERIAAMTPAQRAELHSAAASMSEQQKAALRKVVEHGPMLKKVLIAIVVLFVVVQVGGAILALFWMQ